MRVLFTALSIASTGGVELYLLDLARELLRRGCQPCVYAPKIGAFAERFRESAVPVCDDIRHLHAEPDIIHGNFGLATFAAACRFPHTPVVSMCHAWHWEYDLPPLLPNIHWYLAVDDTCRERLLCKLGAPPNRVRVLHNAVDLTRFAPRSALPERPQRALAFGNYLRRTHLRPLEAACRQRGISLEGLGRGLGIDHAAPETLLGQYDLVFAKGRCAWEALATGCAVVVFDTRSLGPLVSSACLEEYRRANFGRRLLTDIVTNEIVVRRIDQYDAADAARVSQNIRATNSLTRLGDELTSLYEEAIEAHAGRQRPAGDNALALADYAQRLCHELIGDIAERQRRANRKWHNRARRLLQSIVGHVPVGRFSIRNAA